MQVSMKETDGGYELQAHLPRGLRVKMTIQPQDIPSLPPGIVVNQLLPEGGVRRLCDRPAPEPA